MSPATPRVRPGTYVASLSAELTAIEQAFVEMLSNSTIVNRFPRNGQDGMTMVITSMRFDWAPSDNALETVRMSLLRQVRDWEPRFRLLFPHPVATVTKRLNENLTRLTTWLLRDRPYPRLPNNIPDAITKLTASTAELRALLDLLPADEYAVRLVVDTNTLLDDPDLAAHVNAIGPTYVAHLLPTVLGEIDDLKRAGRTPEQREMAKRAERRLKGLRTNGDVRTGVRVAGNVFARFEHIEPTGDQLPSWLDLTVNDDRIVASALLLQADHPGSALYVATSDINMQTKLAAVGMPFIEPRNAGS